MNDALDNRGTTNLGSTLMGIAIGAVIGAGVALLMAPDSGKRTRQRLASTARRLGESAGHTLEQARDTVSELGADARSAIKAGQEAFLHDRAIRESRTNGKRSHSGNATADRNEVSYAGGELPR
jgi:gas vesicle protein